MVWHSPDSWLPTEREDFIAHAQEIAWKTFDPTQRKKLLFYLLKIDGKDWKKAGELTTEFETAAEKKLQSAKQRIRYLWETIWPKFTDTEQENYARYVLKLLWQQTLWEQVTEKQFNSLLSWVTEPEQHDLWHEKLPQYYNIPLQRRLEAQWPKLSLTQNNRCCINWYRLRFKHLLTI